MAGTAPKNSLAARQSGGLASKKQSFSTFMNQPAIRQKIQEVVGGKDGQRFISALVSAVSTNPALSGCDQMTILSSALLGEGLKLFPSPQLGQYYIVPFEDRKNGRTVATFQLGYKGYIQLAIRSGYYKRLNVAPIKEGELVRWDPLSEEFEARINDTTESREELPTIGYYAMFEYLNGFQKVLYWPKAKMEAHALKYSQGYAADKRKGTTWTFWSKDFDGMACKTMLRQLISKWGVMSTELQTAYEADMSFEDNSGQRQYFDNDADLTGDNGNVITVNPETGEAMEASGLHNRSDNSSADTPPAGQDELPDWMQ